MILLYAKREPLSAPSSSLGKDAVSLGAYLIFPKVLDIFLNFLCFVLMLTTSISGCVTIRSTEIF